MGLMMNRNVPTSALELFAGIVIGVGPGPENEAIPANQPRPIIIIISLSLLHTTATQTTKGATRRYDPHSISAPVWPPPRSSAAFATWLRSSLTP